MRTVVTLGLSIWIVVATAAGDESSGDKPATAPAGKTGRITGHEKPRKTGAFRSAAIVECSGLAASRQNPGVLWAHNDSGDSARIFAVDFEGTLVAELAIDGASARDWEDIAIGPGSVAGRDGIYIADTGNNSRRRTDLCVYRIPEPTLKALPRGKRWRSAPAERIRFAYSNGQFDCESIAVHPVTSDIYLFTKSFFFFEVHRISAPHDTGRIVQTACVAKIRLIDLVTAADLSADGRRLILRSYGGLYEYVLGEGQDFEKIFRAKPVALMPPWEIQPEAVCYTPGGSIVTTSEGKGAAIYELRPRRETP